MTGRWIVFEGMDSTVLEEQASHLAGWLRRGGVPAVVTREPTDGPVGAQLHLILSRRLTVDERAQALLSLADRLDHLYRDDDGILQELARDRYVIGIRYLLSAYADQSETVPWEWLERINAPCPWPDLTIFIDTPVQSGLERQAGQGECPPEQTGIQPAGLSLRRTPAGRFVTPEEVAKVVAWLCTDDAQMIVGQTITVDGGYGLLA